MGSLLSFIPASVSDGTHCSVEKQKPLMSLVSRNWFLIKYEAPGSVCDMVIDEMGWTGD